LDKIENLQNHSNRDIYQQSYEIIEKFFSNETDDEDISPTNQSFGTSQELPPSDFGDLSGQEVAQSTSSSSFDLPPPTTDHIPSSSYEPTPSAFTNVSAFEDTPLSRYRSEHDKKLDEKARQSEIKRDKIIEDANNNITKFYNERSDTKDKSLKTNRNNEKKFISDRDSVLSGTNSSNEWARVATLIDFKTAVSAGSKDNSRMRKILIDLKQ